MPPTTGTRTSTRQGRATVRPTNYYARTFAGRIAANGLEQTPESSNSAPGFLPALTHFTAAVDSFPKEIINHFSMFKEVEEQMLKELFDEIAQLPVTTKGQLRNGESEFGGSNSNVDSLPQSFSSLPPEEQVIRKRQLFYRLRVLMAQIIPTLDEKLVVLQAAKITKDKGLMRMHHSFSQLDNEISDEARYGSLNHWAYADKEEKKKGSTTHERQRREVAAANNLAAAAQHVHDVDSIAAKSEARREAVLANKRSRHHQVDSDFDDRPAKKPQKRKPLAADAAPPDNRHVGLGIVGNGAGPHGKRKKTEKALAAATLAAPAMERSLSGALKAAGSGGGRGGSSPRATPGLETAASSKRKPRAAPAPAQRKNQLPTYSPPLASSPLAANFAINKTIARRQRLGSSTVSTSEKEFDSEFCHICDCPGTFEWSTPVVHRILFSKLQAAMLSQSSSRAAGIGASTPRDAMDTAPPFEPLALKQEELALQEPESMDIDMPVAASHAARAGRTSKTATPVVGSFPEIPMARSRSMRNANNSNSNTSSENNSTTTGAVSKRGTKKGPQTTSNAALASPAVKPAPNPKSNPPSSTTSSIPPELENEYPEAESEEDGDEPRYCYCNEVSYGNMVACDNDDCPREWFHLACVNLDKAPVGRTKWFCSDECKEHHAKTKTKGGRPGSSRQ
ncbi:hypothetical protein SNOG_06442 [Parastagonospora nodorum SN15]|uniref:PHD-type domain-containing protein n=1 Tax=Phaeosphaeria nodorum (strain SN15 / ATCC MYA-4574 / FGSC 10173) TaxID=321614 RepID=Q0UP72_PHANO|nr:hypothetical protein SNOG_06442 [Parastagonospora nodorum SN15]EAT86273.2 hypothetical protein SNOG_06442 [Parastagonospora nodorum SN15]